jgi:hypothetical protein
MNIYNKIILLPNLDALKELLIRNEDNSLQSCKCIYEDRIAIQHSTDKDRNTIRIWRTKSLFDYWYDNFNKCSKNFIGALDYTIYDDFIKIDYINICDYEKRNIYNMFLNEYESEELIHALLIFVKNVAKKENKNKIVIDVHENLRIYHKYYYYEGFEITDRKSTCNPFWIETECILLKNLSVNQKVSF